MALPLTRARRRVATVFDLLGDDENDMSAALGWAMAQSPAFTHAIVHDLSGGWRPGRKAIETGAAIALQTGRAGRGITDVELAVSDEFYGIIEAKRGAHLPTMAQLQLYAPTLAERTATRRVLATLTDVAPPLAGTLGVPAAIVGIPVVHRTWRQMRTLARAARGDEGHAAKRVLDQFIDYLGPILGMDTRYSNLVYVVSLGAGIPDGWGISWRDIVSKAGRYFYPVAKGWPEPPNYIAFRYDGRLQSIHHVDDYMTYTNHRVVFPEAPDAVVPLHYCLTLGPAIVPPHKVTNGPRISMSNRCWCMLDTLLTAPTISDALSETKRREAAGA